MATVVVPFRSGGKTRLPAGVRGELSLAMLCDVLEAPSTPSPDVRLVTDDDAAMLLAAELGVEVVRDPGGGQGAAVAAALTGRRRLVPGRQCRPSVRLAGRVVATRPLEPVARRSGRRDDERAFAARTGALRAAVRCGKRRALRRSRIHCSLDPRARAGRRHARGPRAADAARRRPDSARVGSTELRLVPAS